MARTEFQRRMNETYNPDAFKTRRNVFPTVEEVEQKAATIRLQNEATHLAVRALLLGHQTEALEENLPDSKSDKQRPRRKSKAKAKSRGRGKP